MSLELDDCNLLDMQIARTLGKAYTELGFTWLLQGNNMDEDAIEYLKNNDALPKVKTYIEFEIGHSEDYLELQLRGYAMKYPIGNLICTVNHDPGALVDATTFSNGGTLSIYTDSNCQNRIATYSYGRSDSNKTATNSQSITLSGISSDTTLYIQYVRSEWWGSYTYRASFTLGDAVNGKLNIELKYVD